MRTRNVVKISISDCSSASTRSLTTIWRVVSCSRYASTRSGIRATGRMKSASPVAIELRGISPNSASAGSCTSTRPPYSLTRRSPIEPSEPEPERITHTARESCVSASVRKKMSIGARRSSNPVMSEISSMPSFIDRLLLGGMT